MARRQNDGRSSCAIIESRLLGLALVFATHLLVTECAGRVSSGRVVVASTMTPNVTRSSNSAAAASLLASISSAAIQSPRIHQNLPSSSSSAAAIINVSSDEDSSYEAYEYEGNSLDDDDVSASDNTIDEDSHQRQLQVGHVRRQGTSAASAVVADRRGRVVQLQQQQSSANNSGLSDGAISSRDQHRIDRERKKNLRLFMIQQQIVEMLGIQRRPNVSASASAAAAGTSFSQSTSSRGMHSTSGSGNIDRSGFRGRNGGRLDGDIERPHMQSNNRRQSSSTTTHSVDENQHYQQQQQSQTLQSARFRTQNDHVARRYQAVLQKCPATMPTVQPEADAANPAFRLQFNQESFGGNTARATRLISAVLRLKKKSIAAATTTTASVSSDRRRRVHTATTESSLPANGNNRHSPSSSTDRGSADVISVSVYSFNRPTRRGNSRRTSATESVLQRHLVHRVFVNADYVGWVRINIQSAVEDWMQRSGSQQTGSANTMSSTSGSGLLQIVVTDVSGQRAINAFQVFEPQNCSRSPSVEQLIQLSLLISHDQPSPFPSSNPHQATEDESDDENYDPEMNVISEEPVAAERAVEQRSSSASVPFQTARTAEETLSDFDQPFIELITVFDPELMLQQQTVVESSGSVGGATRGGSRQSSRRSARA